MMHMFCYLALYSPKYSDLNDVPIACIVSRRNFIVLLQRASFKDLDQARLVAEHVVATIPEQREFHLVHQSHSMCLKANFIWLEILNL